jgi:uncharacterized protein (DUF2235 family)
LHLMKNEARNLAAAKLEAEGRTLLMEEEKRNVALFLDGTWNTVVNNTNVWRLKALCSEDEHQISYYSVGVGTRRGEEITGGALGLGLLQEIIDAYEWLIENYKEHDQIFIFGFSRGAYTARSLSGLISECGLLRLGAPLGVGQLFERYQKGNQVRSIRRLISESKLPNASFSLEEKWLLEYSAAIPIKFIGVWDTVGALGIPAGNIPSISRKSYQFLETDLRINNDFAYHALAINENRDPFAPTLWTRTITTENNRPARPLNQVEQRWFIGSHANVGGGYDNNLLAQIPLNWIMSKAKLHGMRFRQDLVINGDEKDGNITDSYKEFNWLYRLVSSRYYRPIGQEPLKINPSKTVENINETIDVSVFERWRNDPTYRPKNLVDWAKAKQVSIESLQKSIRADDPTVSI